MMSRGHIQALLLALAAPFAAAQNRRAFCDDLPNGTIDCTALSQFAPVPAQAFEGTGDYLPIPGSDSSNPIKAKQIGGNSVNKLWSLHDGGYFFLVAEGPAGALLVDSPEGNCVISYNQYGVPNATWITDALDALLPAGVELTDMILTHEHWDHIGAAGLVHDHFSSKVQQRPIKVWGADELAEIIELRSRYPNPLFSNNRGIPPLTDKIECQANVVGGGFTFKVMKSSGHSDSDLIMLVDTEDNAGAPMTVLYEVDVVFPGWIPFFDAAISVNYVAFIDHMDHLMTLDFDLLVGGHLTRTGTKADLELQIKLFQAINNGAAQALGTVEISPLIGSTGVYDPTSGTSGNQWILYNEYLARIVDSCYEYVLASPSRGGIDFKASIAGLEISLRSQCWVAQNAIRVGEGHPVHKKSCDQPERTTTQPCLQDNTNSASADAATGHPMGRLLLYALGFAAAL